MNFSITELSVPEPATVGSKVSIGSNENRRTRGAPPRLDGAWCCALQQESRFSSACIPCVM